MFGTVYTYKVAFYPFPAVFITAFSEIPAIYISTAIANIISDLLEILEKAQKDYKAVLVVNEPTVHTHNLNFGTTKNAVAVCCSLKFQSVVEMNKFLEKEIQK